VALAGSCKTTTGGGQRQSHPHRRTTKKPRARRAAHGPKKTKPFWYKGAAHQRYLVLERKIELGNTDLNELWGSELKVPAECRGKTYPLIVAKVPRRLKGVKPQNLPPGILFFVDPAELSPEKEAGLPAFCSLTVQIEEKKRVAKLVVKALDLFSNGAGQTKASWSARPRGTPLLTLRYIWLDRCEQPRPQATEHRDFAEKETEPLVDEVCHTEERIAVLLHYRQGRFVELESYTLKRRGRKPYYKQSIAWQQVGNPPRDILIVATVMALPPGTASPQLEPGMKGKVRTQFDGVKIEPHSLHYSFYQFDESQKLKQIEGREKQRLLALPKMKKYRDPDAVDESQKDKTTAKSTKK
jgi:hypothetical protein